MDITHVELHLPRQGRGAPGAQLAHLIAPAVGEWQQHVVDVLTFEPVAQRFEQPGLLVGAGVDDAAAVGLVEPPPAVAVALQALVEAGHLQIHFRQKAAEADRLLQGAVAVLVLVEPAGGAAATDRLQQLGVSGAVVAVLVGVGLEALQQAAEHEALNQLIRIVVAGVVVVWGVVELLLHPQHGG